MGTTSFAQFYSEYCHVMIENILWNPSILLRLDRANKPKTTSKLNVEMFCL